MEEIDQLLIPAKSKIKFMGNEFVTNHEMIVDGSITKLPKGTKLKKEHYYWEIVEVQK